MHQERTARNSVAALLDVVFIHDHKYITSLVPYGQCITIKSSALCFSYFIYSGTLEIIIALECNQIIVSIQSALWTQSNGRTHRSKYDLNSRFFKKNKKTIQIFHKILTACLSRQGHLKHNRAHNLKESEFSSTNKYSSLCSAYTDTSSHMYIKHTEECQADKHSNFEAIKSHSCQHYTWIHIKARARPRSQPNNSYTLVHSWHRLQHE